MNEVSSFCNGSWSVYALPLITIVLTGVCSGTGVAYSAPTRRGVGAADESGVNLSFPPYAIHNGQQVFIEAVVPLSVHLLTHAYTVR